MVETDLWILLLLISVVVTSIIGSILLLMGLWWLLERKKLAPNPETDQPLESKTKFHETKTKRKMKRSLRRPPEN